MLTLSTATATPLCSKTLSSSLRESSASAYWKPEQPPPLTAMRRTCSVPLAASFSFAATRSRIFSAAVSVIVTAESGVSIGFTF